MVKITFLGAGSTVFARNVLGDCMCTPVLREAEIALYDINAKRLEDSETILRAINHNVNEDRAVIKTYLGVENRKAALRDADFVVNAIQVGGYEPCTVTDFEIPKNTALSRLSEIPWESAESCAGSAPSLLWKASQGIWKRFALIPCF